MAQIIWDGNKNWENVWDGKQPWDREIEEKSIPENAVLIDRPDDIIKASIPYMIIPCIVCFVAIFTKKAQSDEFIFNLWLMPLSFIIGFFVAMPLHEFLHAISYPKGAKVYIGVSLKQLRAYAASSAALTAEMMSALSAVSFETVSMDFIFALPGQTYDDLKSDIDAAFLLGANHVAIYPFIDFTFTESPVTAMPKKDKRELLDAITQYCLGKGYSRNSIWTFSSGTDANYSSMTRDNFLGFGCSATSLFKEQFKINTFDVDSYCERIRSGNLATSLTIRFTKRQRMVYWLFWTAYSTRVTAEDFEKFFGVSLKKMYGFELWVAKQLGLFKEHNGTYEMTLKGAFYYHYYENFYTLSYIDKMWGIMRKEAFPEQIEL